VVAFDLPDVDGYKNGFQSFESLPSIDGNHRSIIMHCNTLREIQSHPRNLLQLSTCTFILTSTFKAQPVGEQLVDPTLTINSHYDVITSSMLLQYLISGNDLAYLLYAGATITSIISHSKPRFISHCLLSNSFTIVELALLSSKSFYWYRTHFIGSEHFLLSSKHNLPVLISVYIICDIHKLVTGGEGCEFSGKRGMNDIEFTDACRKDAPNVL
jgi:hypothetical protein